ncbi:MAG: hypothetical protein ABS84_03585 [Rubrivivax sp. SCN 71-131]|jgi:hypothetical protein|nr:MAG: hypothetical protein ABS84_03585 [Rubrivivax sp. SCN 71-131]
MNAPATIAFDENSARQVLLLRAYETADPPDPAWGTEDRDWATRVARASLPDDAAPARFIAERARHAMQRLAPRETGVRAALAARFAGRAWVLVAMLCGFAVGLAVDHIGAAQRINLLAPPIWALVAWNLLVYLALLVAPLRGTGPGRFRRWLRASWQPKGGRWGRHATLARFALDWAKVAAPLDGARAALVLHLGSAALALGVVCSLYVRGLVLDYLAGWESTFLGAEAVHMLLSALLAPASALTAIPVPDAAALAQMQIGPAHPAQASAGPWIHLYAATLGLFVIGPRLLLAGLARLQAWRLQRRLPVMTGDTWFGLWLQARKTLTGTLWLLPHAAPASATAALALQAALDALSQGRARLQAAPPVPYGEEADPAHTTPPPQTAAVLVLVDLASTPEEEVHGRLLQRLSVSAHSARRILLVDEAGYRQRLGDAATALEARRQAWQGLALAHGATLLAVDLGADATALRVALQEALDA